MNCGKAGRMLQSYLDRDLPARKAQAFEAHLAECPKCKVELSAYQSLLRRLDANPMMDLPLDFVPMVSAELPETHPHAEHHLTCRFARFAAAITRWISPRVADWSSLAAASGCKMVTAVVIRAACSISAASGVCQGFLDRLLSLFDFWSRPRGS